MTQQPVQPTPEPIPTPKYNEGTTIYEQTGVNTWSATSYWERPENLAAAYEQLEADPTADIGADKDLIRGAYEYMRDQNGGTPWYEWKQLDAADPVRQSLTELQGPGDEIEIGAPQDGAGKVQAIGPAATGQPWQPPEGLTAAKALTGNYATFGMTPEQWDAMTPYQQWMTRIFSTGAGAGAAQGAGAAVEAWAGGPVAGVVGMAAGAAIGAGLGGLAERYPWLNKALNVLNIPASAIERSLGLAQFVKATQDPGGPSLWDVYSHLGDAWNAGQLTYETAGNRGMFGLIGDTVEINPVMKLLNQPWEQGAKLLETATGQDWRTPFEVFRGWGEDLLGMVIPKDAAWQLGTPGYTPLAESEIGRQALLNVYDRVQEGASIEQVTQEVYQKLGFDAQLRDMIGSMILDPLNFVPRILGKGLGANVKVAEALGAVGQPAAKIFEQAGRVSEGPVERIRTYGALLREQPVETVSQMGAFSKWLADLDPKTGQPKVLTPANTTPTKLNRLAGAVTTGAIPAAIGMGLGGPLGAMIGGAIGGYAGAKTGFSYLVHLTPQARATEIVNGIALNSAAILERAEADPELMVRYIKALGDTPHELAAELSMQSIESPNGAAAPLALRDFGPRAEALLKIYNANDGKRQVLNNLAAALDLTPEQVLAEMKDVTNSEVLLRRFVERARKAGDDAGKVIVDAFEGGRLTGDTLTEVYRAFVTNNTPWNEDIFRGQLYSALVEHSAQWSAKYFNVQPDPMFIQLGKAIKSAQSLVLLGVNPGYLINNVLNNVVVMASGGVLGLRGGDAIKKFWNDFGITPERLREGVGAMGEAPSIEAIRKAAAGNGILTAISGFFNRATKKVGVFSNLSGQVESWSSAQAHTAGTAQAWQRLWRPGVGFDRLPPALERMLSPDQQRVIYQAIQGGMNKTDIERQLWSGVTRKTIDGVLGEAANALGMNEADVRETLTHAGVYDFVRDRLQGEFTDEDVIATFTELRRNIETHLDELSRQAVVNRAQEAAARVQTEGAQAALELWDRMEADFLDTRMGSLVEWSDTLLEAGLYDRQTKRQVITQQQRHESAQWQRFHANAQANALGITNALGIDNANSRAYVGKMIDHQGVWDSFYQEKYRLQNDFWQKDMESYWPTQAERNAAYQAMQAQINEAYKRATKAEDAIQRDMDAIFVRLYEGQYGPEAGAAARLWRENVRAIRVEMTRRTADFIADLDNRRLSSQERRAAWQKFREEYIRPTLTDRMQANMDGARRMYEEAKRARDNGVTPTPSDPNTPPPRRPITDPGGPATHGQMRDMRRLGLLPDREQRRYNRKWNIPDRKYTQGEAEALIIAEMQRRAQPMSQAAQDAQARGYRERVGNRVGIEAYQNVEGFGFSVEQPRPEYGGMSKNRYAATNPQRLAQAVIDGTDTLDDLDPLPQQYVEREIARLREQREREQRRIEATRLMDEAEARPTTEQITRTPGQQVIREVEPPAAARANQLRRIANEAGIATATERGKPQDTHLLNIVREYAGEPVKSLAEVTPEMLRRAIQERAAQQAEKARPTTYSDLPEPLQAAYREAAAGLLADLKNNTFESGAIVDDVGRVTGHYGGGNIAWYSDIYKRGYTSKTTLMNALRSLAEGKPSRGEKYAGIADALIFDAMRGNENTPGHIGYLLHLGLEEEAARLVGEAAQQADNGNPNFLDLFRDEIGGDEATYARLIEKYQANEAERIAIESSLAGEVTPGGIEPDDPADLAGWYQNLDDEYASEIDEIMERERVQAYADMWQANVDAWGQGQPMRAQVEIIRKTREQVRSEIAAAFSEASPEEIDAVMALMDARAKAWANASGRAPGEWYETHVAGAQRGLEGEGLYQTAPRVDTPEFKAWFGDSKVVDKQGQPLVMYHGTGGNFDTFDPNRVGQTFGVDDTGFFFTNDPGEAGNFAKVAAGEETYDTSGGPTVNSGNANIMPVYLKAEKPLSFPDRKWSEIIYFPEGDPLDGRSAIEWYDDHKRIIFDYIDYFNEEGGPLDSIIVRDERMNINGEPEVLVVVFSPEQIKSTFNRGTFDPDNPNILLQGEERGAKGAVSFMDDGRAIIHALNAPDVSTLFHEVGHIFRRDLSEADHAIAAEWAGAEYNTEAGTWTWSRAAEEKFARGFEEYLREGKAPTEGLARVFEQAKEWLSRIYNSLRGRKLVEINDNMREVYAHLLTEQGGEAGGEAGTLFQTAPRVDTPEFRAWFGDSKVVDEQGQPLVVYHGTGAQEFSEFYPNQHFGQASQANKLIEFTVEAETNLASRGEPSQRPHNYRVIPVYLSIQNPLRVKDMGSDWKFTILDAMRDGYDGLVYENMVEGKGDSYIAFSPSQIKSTFNQGTFDPDNPNILFQFETDNGPARLFDDGTYEQGGEVRDINSGEEPPAAGLPLGTVEGMNPHPDFSSVTEQGYRERITPMLRELESRMTGKNATWQGGFKPGQLDPVSEREVRAYLGKIMGQMSDAKLAASRIGEQRRDAALLNYNKRYGFDNVLQTVMPYEFFYTRSMMEWALRSIDRPAWLANWARLRAMQQQGEREGFPQRLKGKMAIRVPFLPEWAGENIYIDPLHIAFPFEMLMRPFRDWAEARNQEDSRAVNILYQMLADEQITEQQLQQTMSQRSGDLWQKALTQAKAEYQGEMSNPLDFITAISGLSLPASIAYNIAMGRDVSTLPITRTLQSLTSWATPGGWSGPEGWIRKAVGLPERGKMWDYYVDRMLANMAAENPAQTQDILRAMVERSGPLFEEATRRIGNEQAAKNWAGALWMDLFPEGEQEQRGLQAEFYAAAEAGNLAAFYEAHPEYRAQLEKSNWDDPEQRMRSYLISQIWDRRRALDPLSQREADKQLGKTYNEAFINKETRSYDSISTATLAMWANRLGATLPKNAPDVPQQEPLTMPSEAATGAYQNYITQKGQLFPNIQATMDAYYQLPDSMRAKYREMHPVIQQYWNWRDQVLGAQPELIPYLTSETSEVSGAAPEIQQAYYQYRAEKAQLWGNIDSTLNQYYDLTGTAAKAYYVGHPEIGAYYDWQKAALAAQPEIIPYVKSTESIARSVLGDAYEPDYQIDVTKFQGPLMSEIIGMVFAGRRLGNGASAEMRRIWEKEGRPYGNFNVWQNYVIGYFTGKR